MSVMMMETCLSFVDSMMANAVRMVMAWKIMMMAYMCCALKSVSGVWKVHFLATNSVSRNAKIAVMRNVYMNVEVKTQW